MPALPTRLSIPEARRRLLARIALLLGIVELADSFFISFWIGALVFAVLFVAAAAWIRRGGVGGPILAAALCVFELQSYPTWQRHGSGDWISQTAFVAVAALELALAAAVVAAPLLKGTARSTTR